MAPPAFMADGKLERPGGSGQAGERELERALWGDSSATPLPVRVGGSDGVGSQEAPLYLDLSKGMAGPKFSLPSPAPMQDS